MNVLDVADLCVAFPGGGRWNAVVDRVGFSVAPRETLAIVGESGSGKSVTALAAMRLLPPAARVAGRVALAGRDLLSLPEAEMEALRGREMAMIFQEPMTSLNPVMTIGAQRLPD
ncbi:MAG: ATP-binding cassette domain-containing protein, partial [Alphaproteobacteria bacterium]